MEKHTRSQNKRGETNASVELTKEQDSPKTLQVADMTQVSGAGLITKTTTAGKREQKEETGSKNAGGKKSMQKI